VIFLKTGTSTFNQCERWNVMEKKRIEKFYPETVLHQNNMIKFGKSMFTLQASSFYLFFLVCMKYMNQNLCVREKLSKLASPPINQWNTCKFFLTDRLHRHGTFEIDKHIYFNLIKILYWNFQWKTKKLLDFSNIKLLLLV